MPRSDERFPFLCAIVLACSPDEPAGIPAIFDESRAEHFFDLPFPSQTSRQENGRPDLSGFPVAGLSLTEPLIEGWRTRVELATNGFASSGSTYFRFEGPLELPIQTEGSPQDPVLLIDLDTYDLYPLSLRFYDEPHGDPYLASNLLAVSPQLTNMPPPGRTLSVVVMDTAGASPPTNGAFEIDETL